MSNTDTGDTTGGIQPPRLPPRESLIGTAVNFLNNPNVLRSPLQQKQKFLRSKGLTDEEIQIACERAGVFSSDPNSTVINMGITTNSANQGYRIEQSPSMLTRLKDTLNSMALISGLAYAAYLFYKKFIEPFLFGKKKKKTFEECIEKMEKKLEDQIKELNQEVIRVREEVSRSSQQDYINQEISSFKSEIETIKGLFLNTKQFANPLPIVPPSIPAWQLTSRHSETEPDKNDDAGSGSGSSETEVVTKNSDGSVEII